MRDLGYFLKRDVRVCISGVSELIGGFISLGANGWKDEVAAGEDTSRTEGEDSVACLVRLAAVLLTITGDAGVVIVVAICVEVTASGRKLQIARGQFCRVIGGG